MKKRSVLFVALFLISAVLFAKPVKMNWVWELENPQVTSFRYQIDDENPNKWIVVDSSITSYSLTTLDSPKAHTLYVQQSYDGKNFGPSGRSVMYPLPLSSESMEMNWVWKLDDPNVTTFRYQVDGQNPDKWVVVDSSVSSYGFISPDGNKAHILYVQQSYDGKNFGLSGKSIIDPDPQANEELVALWDKTDIVAGTTAAERKKADSRFKRTITLGGDVSYFYQPISSSPPPLHVYNVNAELGLQLKNMLTFNKTFGLGMDISLEYAPYNDCTYGWRQAVKDVFKDFDRFWDGFVHTGRLSGGPMLNMQLGKIEFDLGGGGFINYGPEFKSPKNPIYNYMYGAYGKIGLSYQVSSWFSMGMNAKYNFVLLDFKDIREFSEVGVFMGFSF